MVNFHILLNSRKILNYSSSSSSIPLSKYFNSTDERVPRIVKESATSEYCSILRRNRVENGSYSGVSGAGCRDRQYVQVVLRAAESKWGRAVKYDFESPRFSWDRANVSRGTCYTSNWMQLLLLKIAWVVPPLELAEELLPRNEPGQTNFLLYYISDTRMKWIATG